MKWIYQATKSKEDPYESIIERLNPCTPEVFRVLSREEKEVILNQIVAEVRKINIFPIYYFNTEGIKKEIKETINKQISFEEDILKNFNYQGLIVLDFLFPNLHTATAKDENNTSMYERFYDDNTLKLCMEQALLGGKITNMRSAFLNNGRYMSSTPTNYPPMRAKAIFERFCPKGGTIYDYSAGFGGRMLGALSSKNDFIYIGTDPNTQTYENLQELGKYIEETTHRINSYQLYNECSENLILPNDTVDFAFSCPPYFTLEKYCDEKTQSTNKFPEYNDWLQYYVRLTIKNCYVALKDKGLYGVNISNFTLKHQKYRIVEDWIKIAREEGFYLKGIFTIASKSRRNEEDIYDKDNIYIFSKNKEDLWMNSSSPILSNNKSKEVIVKYDILGRIEEIYDSISNITNYTSTEIKKAIKSQKILGINYYRKFLREENIPEEIEVKKPICLIDTEYFYSFAEAGRFIGVSRQAVAQAKNRQSKKIGDKEVYWID